MAKELCADLRLLCDIVPETELASGSIGDSFARCIHQCFLGLHPKTQSEYDAEADVGLRGCGDTWPRDYRKSSWLNRVVSWSCESLKVGGSAVIRVVV